MQNNFIKKVLACLSALIIALGIHTAHADAVLPSDTIFTENRHLFDIPEEIRMTFEIPDWEQIGDIAIGTFRFKSLENGFATGTIARPSKEGKYPVFMGGFGTSHLPRHSRIPALNLLRQSELVFIALDPPHHRVDRTNNQKPGDHVFQGSQDREEQIQYIKDWRSIVSMLSQLTFADESKIVYYGFSHGAAIGGLLAGVEPRIRAYALASGDGGLLTHHNWSRSSHTSGWAGQMLPVEPIHYIAHTENVSLLFQNGEMDWVVRHADALLYQESANSPDKEIMWYPDGHFLSCEATKDALSWLDRFLEQGDFANYECSDRIPVL